MSSKPSGALHDLSSTPFAGPTVDFEYVPGRSDSETSPHLPLLAGG